MNECYELGGAAYRYAFRSPVCLWFTAVVDNKALRDLKPPGYSPMGDEYARIVEAVSRDIGKEFGLDQDQMTKRCTLVLYPFDMNAQADKRKKIQEALRTHLPRMRKYDFEIPHLLHDLEKARYDHIK